jgi:hypothetical protein
MIAIVTAFIAAFGQAEREATEGGHRGKVGADGVEGNIQLKTGSDQIDRGGCGLIGTVLDEHRHHPARIAGVRRSRETSDRNGVVIQAAMGGHMSVTAFTKLNYARIALKIGREAKDAGLQPVARHLWDYLQMETSFVAGSEGFSTVVDVPLIDMKSALTIWEHHILPLTLEDGLYLNIGPSNYTHIAVTADHKLYRAMSRAEFNTCRRVGEFYLCDRCLVVTKAPELDAPPPQWKDPALCWFAPFSRQFDLATATCRTSIGGTEAAMRMVAPDVFGSYTNKPHRQ